MESLSNWIISFFRVVICPLLYAPKFCDHLLNKNENLLAKIITVNQWIKNFNESTTGLNLNLDRLGVQSVPQYTDGDFENQTTMGFM